MPTDLRGRVMQSTSIQVQGSRLWECSNGWHLNYAKLAASLLNLCSATESTQRLCMRRKKKKAKGKGRNKPTEASFLRRRRDAVRKAASNSEMVQPSWMKGLASTLWTKEHAKEQNFNRDKFRKKELLGFKRGLYQPSSKKEEQTLKKALTTYETHENKRRRTYILSVEKRLSACFSPLKSVVSAFAACLKFCLPTQLEMRSCSCQSQLSGTFCPLSIGTPVKVQTLLRVAVLRWH